MKVLLLIAAAGFALRLAAVVPLHAGGPTSDEKDYIHLAWRLAGGGDFVDLDGESSKRAPLFPYLLAALLVVSGGHAWILYVVNALLGGAAVLLSGLIGEILWREPALSRAVAWAVAMYPGLIAYGAVLQTESLYIALFLGAMLAIYRLAALPGWGAAAVLGVTAGLAALTRGVLLGLFPFLLILAGVAARRLRGSVPWRELALAAVVFLAVLTPWTVRNYRVHGALVPVVSIGGRLLLLGNNPYATGTWSTRPGFQEWYGNELQHRGWSGRVLTERERNEADLRIGLDYALSHPLAGMLLALKKAQIFWFYPVTTSDSHRPLQALAVMADILLLLAAMAGAARMRSPALSLIPVGGVLLLSTAVSLVLHAEARYRLPLVPLICLAAGWSALPSPGREEWARALRKHPTRTRWVVAGTAVVLAAYAITAWMVLTERIN